MRRRHLLLGLVPVVKLNLLDAGSLDILLGLVGLLHTGNGTLEAPAALLRTEHSSENNTEGDDGSSNAHDGAVGLDLVAVLDGDEGVLSDGVDNLSRGGRNHVSDLVGDTREGGSEGRRRQLVEVDGNDTPGTLNKELHEEARGAEAALTLGEDPGGNEDTSHEGGDDDGASAADELTGVSDDGATDAGANLHDNGSARSTGVLKLLLGDHEGGVRVLGGVGEVVEPSHEDSAVNTHLPLGPNHLLAVAPESTGGGGGGLPRLAGFEELLRLGEGNADETDGDGDASYIMLVMMFFNQCQCHLPAIQKTVFQLSVLPPTPRLAHAAKT